MDDEMIKGHSDKLFTKVVQLHTRKKVIGTTIGRLEQSLLERKRGILQESTPSITDSTGGYIAVTRYFKLHAVIREHKINTVKAQVMSSMKLNTH